MGPRRGKGREKWIFTLDYCRRGIVVPGIFWFLDHCGKTTACSFMIFDT